MNAPIEIKPTDGPLTVYVVAVLFVRRVAPDGVFGTGFGEEETLIAYQFTRPGENPLLAGDAIECGIQHIRKQWGAVKGSRSDPAHFGVVRTNLNSTVIRPAAVPTDLTNSSESSEPQEPAHPVKREKAKTLFTPEGDPTS